MAHNMKARERAGVMSENGSEPQRAPWRDRTADLIVPLARPILGLLLAALLPAASATFTMARCCTLAVREDFHEHIDLFYPWEVCNLNVEIDYSDNKTYASVTRNMGWAKEHCRGTQYSSLTQWLLPLATYISPYLGILLLCPVGDVVYRAVFSARGWGLIANRANRALFPIRRPLQEIVSILGDPSSAIFGALHEVWSDARTVPGITSQSARGPEKRRQRASWVAVLAGNLECLSETKWDRGIEVALDALDALPAPPPGDRGPPSSIAGITTTTTSSTKPAGAPDDAIQEKSPSSAKEEESALARLSLPAQTGTGTPTDRIDAGIETLMAARMGFSSGILLPVLLMLAVTAATFYDAYSKRGDKDTGLDLAYCVWYSWILVLGVSANCSVSALNPDVAARALRGVVDFGKPRNTALRQRYLNNWLWRRWARVTHQDPWDYGLALAGLGSNPMFWLRFCAGQLLGFCCVAFSVGCAAAIAWTTPTTGLGCRSFNFILYAILAFATAYMHVLCSWLTVRSKAGWPAPLLLLVARCTYWLLVIANALVMILGTIFHLVGVFRTCWCERLTWNDAMLIELNSKTAQAVENARTYWLSTAYVGFGVVWLVCLTAIVFRGFIVLKMDEWVNSRERAQDKEDA